MSDPVPSAWVEAVAQAMVAAGMGYGKPVDDRLATVAITAVEPLIRADERASADVQIAQAIEERNAFDAERLDWLLRAQAAERALSKIAARSGDGDE